MSDTTGATDAQANSTEDPMVEFYDKIDKKINDFMTLCQMHERERDEAQYLVDTLNIENQRLRDELEELHFSNEKVVYQTDLTEDIEKLKKELSETKTKYAKLHRDFSTELESLKHTSHIDKGRINELEVQAKHFNEERIQFEQFKMEMLRRYSQLKKFKEYLLSNQMNKLESVLADPNIYEKAAKLGTLERNCDKLDEYYLQCIKEVRLAKREINGHLLETMKQVEDPNAIVIVRFCYNQSIQVLNKSLVPIDISEWTVKIFNGLSTELFEYKLPHGAILQPNKMVNLWSRTAKGSKTILRNDVMLVAGTLQRHKGNDKSIWLDHRTDLSCALYDENLNIKASKDISL